MTNRIQRGDLQVSEELDKLISEKVCVNIDVEPEQFWNSFNAVVKEFTPRNKALLAEREEERETVKELFNRLTEVVENPGD